MKAAAIDIGSNTVRLLVASSDTGAGSPIPLVHERAITRLARGIDSSGRLDPEGVLLTLDAISNFADIAAQNGISPESMLVAGTSALREASDRLEFISSARNKTGLHVQVLSPEEEASATALGVMSGFPGVSYAFLLDIGGGSTEAIIVAGRKVAAWCSVPSGVVKLIDRHLQHMGPEPPLARDMDALNKDCLEIARKIKSSLWPSSEDKVNTPPEFIATAGTATTAASIDMALEKYDRGSVNGYIIKLPVLKGMHERLAAMPLAQRQTLKGLEKGREDLIIPGLALTIGIMDVIGFDAMRVSDNGLLEGLCLMAMDNG